MSTRGKAKRYRVRFVREDGSWIATALDFQGCRSDGRTLAQARRRILEAISACIEDDVEASRALSADLVEEFIPPDSTN